eukprot:g15175.t1
MAPQPASPLAEQEAMGPAPRPATQPEPTSQQVQVSKLQEAGSIVLRVRKHPTWSRMQPAFYLQLLHFLQADTSGRFDLPVWQILAAARCTRSSLDSTSTSVVGTSPPVVGPKSPFFDVVSAATIERELLGGIFRQGVPAETAKRSCAVSGLAIAIALIAAARTLERGEKEKLFSQIAELIGGGESGPAAVTQVLQAVGGVVEVDVEDAVGDAEPEAEEVGVGGLRLVEAEDEAQDEDVVGYAYPGREGEVGEELPRAEETRPVGTEEEQQGQGKASLKDAAQEQDGGALVEVDVQVQDKDKEVDAAVPNPNIAATSATQADITATTYARVAPRPETHDQDLDAHYFQSRLPFQLRLRHVSVTAREFHKHFEKLSREIPCQSCLEAERKQRLAALQAEHFFITEDPRSRPKMLELEEEEEGPEVARHRQQLCRMALCFLQSETCLDLLSRYDDDSSSEGSSGTSSGGGGEDESDESSRAAKGSIKSKCRRGRRVTPLTAEGCAQILVEHVQAKLKAAPESGTTSTDVDGDVELTLNSDDNDVFVISARRYLTVAVARKVIKTIEVGLGQKLTTTSEIDTKEAAGGHDVAVGEHVEQGGTTSPSGVSSASSTGDHRGAALDEVLAGPILPASESSVKKAFSETSSAGRDVSRGILARIFDVNLDILVLRGKIMINLDHRMGVLLGRGVEHLAVWRVVQYRAAALFHERLSAMWLEDEAGIAKMKGRSFHVRSLRFLQEAKVLLGAIFAAGSSAVDFELERINAKPTSFEELLHEVRQRIAQAATGGTSTTTASGSGTATATGSATTAAPGGGGILGTNMNTKTTAVAEPPLLELAARLCGFFSGDDVNVAGGGDAAAVLLDVAASLFLFLAAKSKRCRKKELSSSTSTRIRRAFSKLVGRVLLETEVKLQALLVGVGANAKEGGAGGGKESGFGTTSALHFEDEAQAIKGGELCRLLEQLGRKKKLLELLS